MAAAKITINSNGSIRVEGEFEIVDPEGRAFGLADVPPSAFAVAATRPTSRSAMARTRLLASATPSLLANCPRPNRNCEWGIAIRETIFWVRLSQTETFAVFWLILCQLLVTVREQR